MYEVKKNVKMAKSMCNKNYKEGVKTIKNMQKLTI